MSNRGLLIVFEGLDRTGKTTQSTSLLTKLNQQGKETKLIKLPDRTTNIGKLINTYLTDSTFELSDESAHLLFSANRWELNQYIHNTLNMGVNIILDRYVYSGVAYTSAKGLDFEWCLLPDKGLPRPDLVVFLSFSDDSLLVDREGYGDERYEVKSFQDKVKLQFNKFSDLEKNWNCIKVDNKSIEQVEKEVRELVEMTMDKPRSDIEFF